MPPSLPRQSRPAAPMVPAPRAGSDARIDELGRLRGPGRPPGPAVGARRPHRAVLAERAPPGGAAHGPVPPDAAGAADPGAPAGSAAAGAAAPGAPAAALRPRPADRHVRGGAERLRRGRPRGADLRRGALVLVQDAHRRGRPARAAGRRPGQPGRERPRPGRTHPAPPGPERPGPARERPQRHRAKRRRAEQHRPRRLVRAPAATAPAPGPTPTDAATSGGHGAAGDALPSRTPGRSPVPARTAPAPSAEPERPADSAALTRRAPAPNSSLDWGPTEDS